MGQGKSFTAVLWIIWLASILAAGFDWPVASAQNVVACGGVLGRFVSGGIVYRVTSETYPPTGDLQSAIRKTYGDRAEIADWNDLKRMATDSARLQALITGTSLPSPTGNAVCDNILVNQAGRSTFQGMHFLIARHDGLRPPGWAILDTIGPDVLHLGRWNQVARVLIKMPLQDSPGQVIANDVSRDGKNQDAQYQHPFPRALSQNRREDPGLRNEWARVTPTEQACIDESLKPQGLNTLALRQQGIYPADTRLMRIRQACSIGLTVQQFDEQQAKAAQEAQRIKDQKAAETAEAQAQREQRLAKIREKRDPSDVVGQVLNYSSGLPDEGTEAEFWYQQGTRCMYHLYENNPGVLMRAQMNAVLGAMVGQKQPDLDDISIDLNDMDPRLITFSNEYSEFIPDNQSTRMLYGQNIPQQKPITVVRYDGKVLFTAVGTLPIDRLQRGWGMIYEKYCQGKQKAF